MSAKALLQLIMRERSKDVDTVPPGFKRADEWATLWGLERTRTKQLLAWAVERGHAERRTFRVLCGIKRCPVMHYRPGKEITRRQKARKH